MHGNHFAKSLGMRNGKVSFNIKVTIMRQTRMHQTVMQLKPLAVLLAFALLIFIALSNYLTPAFAQSNIERSFVPKSKLHNPIWTKHDAGSTIVVDHSAWDSFLGKYIKTNAQGVNLVAYGSVSGADKAALGNYLNALQNVDVTKLNRKEQYAYWFNLYNASTVSVVLKRYPIKSIRDIKKNKLDIYGPFNDTVVKVNGKKLTLNKIESGIVRPIWNDPLLHYGFNCAAVTCPNLGKKAFTGAKVNSQLRAAAVAYVNSPRGVTIKDGKIVASKIYFWYEGDFGGSETAILNHLIRYANKDLKAKLAGKTTIEKYIYDWSLNDAR